MTELAPLALDFKAKLEFFFDRGLATTLDPIQNRFLRWTGGDIRKLARRNLKPAKQKKVSELTERESYFWERQKAMYASGERAIKPRRADASAKKGETPRLHFRPNPLRDGQNGILFALSPDKDSIVVGPSSYGDNAAESIEEHNPFMSPALEAVRPTIPDILKRAIAA